MAVTPAIIIEVSSSFPQSLQARASKVPDINCDCFLSNHFQFISHQMDDAERAPNLYHKSDNGCHINRTLSV
jgi:hypothetical protein